MNTSIAGIVIPVYKEAIDENESKSLVQCLKVLYKYPLFFACPENLNTSCYEDLCNSHDKRDVTFIRFDAWYFSSIEGYNRLMLSAGFYDKFSAFEYILLYQLDAWVFKDELEYWAKKGFDYIGAPWFIGQDKAEITAGLMGNSGNGGFSLRKVRQFLKVIHGYKILKSPADILKEYRHFNFFLKLIRVPVIILRFLGLRNNSTYARNHYLLNEDNYWANLAAKVEPSFRVAKGDEAIEFAFELFPKRLYDMNGNQLPFGCHGWAKYENEFWSKYIK